MELRTHGKFTRTDLLREKEWRRCRGQTTADIDAFFYWCAHYIKIRTADRGSILFELFPEQRNIMEVWSTEHYSIVLKARQIGWTTLAAIYALWLCVFWPDQVIVFLSKKESEAIRILNMSIYAYERLPTWMQDRGPKRLTKNKQDIKFANASEIQSLPSKEDPARGHTVTLVVVDEWAFLDNPEDAWASIEPIADVGGRVIGLSTANGVGDFFHDLWMRAKTGRSQFKPMFYPWHARAGRDDAWYEKKRNELNNREWMLAQEYPSSEEEAFRKSGRPVFDLDALDKIRAVLPSIGDLNVSAPASKREPLFEDRKGGLLKVWELPKVGGRYAIGADTAAGLEHGDYCSAHVLDARTGRVVAHYHARIDPDVFGTDVLATLGWWFNRALIGVEVNNHGLTTCKALQREMYPNQYYRRSIDTRSQRVQEQVGWYTSTTTKPVMIDDLGAALRDASIIVEDADTIKELMSYSRDEKGATSGQPFDDRVMSLALARQMMPLAWTDDFAKADEIPYMSEEWWRLLAEKDDVEGKRPRIGSFNVRSAA